MADEKPIGEKCPCCEKPFRTEGRWEPGVCCKREFPEGSVAGCYDDGRQLALKRLAAAEAMLEDARKLAEMWLGPAPEEESVAYESRMTNIARRILASRPSEQAAQVVTEFVAEREEQLSRTYDSPLTQAASGYRPSEERKPECPHGVGLCTSTCPSKQPAEQASKEDSRTPDEIIADEMTIAEWRTLAESKQRRIEELEAQLATARAQRQTFHDDYWVRVRQCDELKAKLEAAEAERERGHDIVSKLLAAIRLVPDQMQNACEQADRFLLSVPLQPSQPERLGGLVEVFRSELILALESVEAEFSVRKALADVAAALKNVSRRIKRP